MAASKANRLVKTDWLMSGSHLLPGGRSTPFGVQAASPLQSIYYKGGKFEAKQPGLMVGHGYRAYLSSLARFVQPDVLSPFGRGGWNTYCYCLNDPLNRVDPSGAASIGKILRKLFASSAKKPNMGSRVKTLTGITASQERKVSGLRNGYPQLLEAEYNLFSKNYIQDPRRVLTTTQDMVGLDVGVDYKFIWARDRFIVSPSGPKGSQKYISHAVLAELMPGTSVEGAGMLTKGSLGDVLLTNYSGHFKPSADLLARPGRYLEGLGFEVTRLPVH